MKTFTTLLDVRQGNALVASILGSWKDDIVPREQLEKCIVALANFQERLTEKLINQEALLPRRIRVRWKPVGSTVFAPKVFVYHCPDELIPLEEVEESDVRPPHSST